MTTNPYLGMTEAAFSAMFGQRERRQEINVPVANERRKQTNLANQLDDLCKVCGIAGECTCTSEEEFYADRATWIDVGMP